MDGFPASKKKKGDSLEILNLELDGMVLAELLLLLLINNNKSLKMQQQ